MRVTLTPAITAVPTLEKLRTALPNGARELPHLDAL